MSGVGRSWEGACRCGQLRFHATAAPLLTMACHCRGCQQMTASAFSLSAAIPADAFAVTAGEPTPGGLRGELQHSFCPRCLSWCFTRLDPSLGFVNVRATLFEPVAWARPFMETQTAEKVSWASTPAVHSFERFPPPEAYPELLADFAARREEFA